MHLKKRLVKAPTKCFETYGMTETLTHVAVRAISKPIHQQRFWAFKGIQLRVSSNQQLSILAPHISPLWIETNDVAQVAPDGSFELLGRVDHVINSGGLKLFPQEIEGQISHLIDEHFFVIGQKDVTLGERAVIVIEGIEWSKEELNRLMDELRKVLPSNRIPKAVFFSTRFERTATGKLLRPTKLN